MAIINDAIIFESTPGPGVPTVRTANPFTLTLSSGTTGVHVIDLYAENSRSRPYQDPQNIYGHLLPQWHFEDEAGNIINSIATTDTIVYSGTQTLGTVGSATFYYVDDMPSLFNSPVLLWATLQTSGIPVSYDNEKQSVPGYANSEVMAVFPHVINPVNPTHLEITRDGINDINALKWATVKFPYVITLKGNLDSYCDNNGVESVTIFDYPSSNSLGQQYSITRNINKVASSSQAWSPVTTYFKRTNGGYYVGGFEKGSVVSYVSSLNTTISAETTVQYTTAYQDIPFIWVSNPDNRTINKVTYFGVTSHSDDYFSQYIPAAVENYSVPFVTAVPDAFSLSGFGGIFGIVIDKCFNAWMADVELNKLFKYNVIGEMLSSIDLNTLLAGTSSEYYTPAGLALDSSNNLWVTLFDSVSTLKFDSSGNLLLVAEPTSFVAATSSSDSGALPVQVDTDVSDNIWVTYNHPQSGKLIRYNSSGIESLVVDLDPASACPVDLIVDTDNSLWVANCHLYQAVSGTVQKYSSAGVLLSSFSANRPTFITLDSNSNPWFTYGYNNIGYVVSGTFGGFSISAAQFFSADNTLTTESILGGIACDTKNRIWAIDSVGNAAYVFPATSDLATLSSQMVSFKIRPDQNLSWFNDGGVYTEVDPNAESAQAFSDWTGYRWKRKYDAYDPYVIVTASISGISNVFDIKSFRNDNVIRRYNESWDAGSQMRSYALPEHINNKYNLFVDFLTNAIGGTRDDEQHLGQQYYEKIANFVNNHRDITEANIDLIYSLAHETDVPIDDYGLNYPSSLKRIMDIVSINHNELWGSRCKCNENFDGKYICSNCNHAHSINRGTGFSSSTYIVTAGQPFIVKYRFGNSKYYLLNPVSLSGSSTYPLSSAPNIEWLQLSDYINYNFYTHIPTYCNTQIEGVINWDDPYTTLSENNSALSAWYGDNGIVEEMINFTLHEGLRLNNG